MTPRILTGHTITMVRVADGEVAVMRGQALPADVVAAEIERLERLGAFAPAPVADLVAQGAARVPGTTAAAPSAQAGGAVAEMRAELEAKVAQAAAAFAAEREALAGERAELAERRRLLDEAVAEAERAKAAAAEAAGDAAAKKPGPKATPTA